MIGTTGQSPAWRENSVAAESLKKEEHFLIGRFFGSLILNGPHLLRPTEGYS